MLKEFFKPKWQHAKAEVRREAIENLAATEVEVLSEIAKTDLEPSLRCLAVKKLADMAVLEELMNNAHNWEVQQLAKQCFYQLLGGNRPDAPSRDVRLARLRKIDDLVALEHLAKNAADPDLRLAVLEKVSQDALCGDMAINDPAAQNRLVAVEKITGKPTLERVVEQTRNKDKGVYRIAKERLDAIIEAEEKPKRLRAEREALCRRLEIILKAGNCDGCDSELANIAQQWAAVEGEPEVVQALQFQQLNQSIQQARELHIQQQALLKERRGTKQQIIDAMSALWQPMAEQETLDRALAPLQVELDEHEAAWRLSHAVLNAEEEADWQQRFHQLSSQIRQQLHVLEHNNSLQQKLNKICKDMEKLLSGSAPIPKQRPKDFEKRWHEVFPKQPGTNFVHRFNDRFNTNLQALHKRHDEQMAQREVQLETLKTKLGELEQTLSNGELHSAEPLDKECRELLRGLVDVPRNQQDKLEKRLHSADAQIKELRSWQRWGNKREREELCEAMEALVGSQENPEILAKQVQDLQKSWQHLAEMDHSHALWQRFHRASQAAYAPCKVHFEQRALERKDNLAQREALCVELETFAEDACRVNEVDGKKVDPDWKPLHHRTQKFRKQWHDLGPTNRKARKTLDERFNAAMSKLDALFEPERERNLRMRRQLISKAEALADEKELDKAMEAAKALQKSWLITVPSNRKDERDLWKNFRAACDAVFVRRDEVRKNENQEMDDNLAAKKALCEELENLAKSGGDALHSAALRISNAEQQWSDIGMVPRNAVKDIERRFNKACRSLDKAYQDWQVDQQRSQLDVLRQKAALCSRVERATADTAEALITDAESEWAQLAELDKADERAIRSRFEYACTAARNGQVPLAESEFASQAQEILCIRLEIIAGVDSPPEGAKARMAYQVERLARAMSGERPDSESGENEAQVIEREWYFSGPCSAALAQRFDTVLAALKH